MQTHTHTHTPLDDAPVIKLSLWRGHDGVLGAGHLSQGRIGQLLGHMIHDAREELSRGESRQTPHCVTHSLEVQRWRVRQVSVCVCVCVCVFVWCVYAETPTV